MQFAHSGSETEKQPQLHPVPTHTTSPRRPTEPHPRRSTAPERIPPHDATPAPFHNTAPVPLHGAEHVSTHDAVPAPFHSDQPTPSYNAAASLPCPGTVQEPHHSGKPIHPQHRTMVATRAASRRCTIAPKPHHLTLPCRVCLAPPRHCSRAAGGLKTKNWPVLQLEAKKWILAIVQHCGFLKGSSAGYKYAEIAYERQGRRHPAPQKKDRSKAILFC